MKKIKQISSLITYNLRTLLLFEGCYKLFTFLLFTPIFSGLFQTLMKLSGYTYLTIENVIPFLCNPLTVLSLFLFVFLMTLYTMLDIATIIIILDASAQKKKICVKTSLKMACKTCLRVFHISNISLSFLVLFLIPLLHIGLASSFITTIKIPEFIMEFILQNQTLFLLLIIVFTILSILSIRWLYALHYFVIEDVNFQKARKMSSHLGHKNHIKDIFALFLVQTIGSILYLLFIFIGIFFIFLMEDWLKILLMKSFLAGLIWLFIALSALAITILSTPLAYAMISVLYYQHKVQKKEEIKHLLIDTSSTSLFKKRFLKTKIVISLFIIACSTLFTSGLYQGKYDLNIEYKRDIEVTAHRGDSISYPENTMAAFKGAKEKGADWIELDVQQTKDGELIVIHDTNFKRTTGVDKNTWELTLEEVKELDAGAFFHVENSDLTPQKETIPTLEEVILYAKEKQIKLNIELKPTGHETNFEVQVVDLILKHDFIDNCVITSQVYEVLEHVKAYHSDITTVYVMSLAIGDITSLTYADHFSVEATNVTRSLVKKIHKEGKQLYVWTVNTKENMEKMIDLNVDNIITDHIELAKNTIYQSKTSDFIQEYIKWLDKIF